MQHDDPLLLHPANDEDEVEDNVLCEEAATVEVEEVGQLPGHVGGDTENVVEQGVSLQNVISPASPGDEEPQC